MAKGLNSGHKLEVRHGALRRSSGWMNALRILGTAAIVVVLSGIATVAYAVWGLAQVDTVEMPQTGPGIEAGATEIDGAFSILIVGSDTREGQKYNDLVEGELNDVTMLMHVSADHKNATVMSFPRDLMIPVPSCESPDGGETYPMAEAQLNSTLSVGGLPCVAATISELTGMDVPYAGLVTFDGVIAVTNALGGVEVCLAEPIVDPNTELDLPAGNVSLKGMEALQFLRTRYGVGDGGDQSRISSQQMYMSSLARKLQDENTLSDPLKVYTLAKAGLENMTLSSNMASVQFMQAVAGTVRNIDLENINFVQYPVTQHAVDPNRVSPDYENAALLIDLIQEGKPFVVTETGTGVGSEDDESKGSSEEESAAEETESEIYFDEASGLYIDAATGEVVDPPETEVADESSGPETDENGAVVLPPGITGQAAKAVTCSQGRTVY